MKRRAHSRRQVLDLNSKVGSPKRSWQSKYQQICLDHSRNSSAPQVVENNSEVVEVKEKKLPQLVGYGSDSDVDEPMLQEDLESKVDDFLKEISAIDPSEPETQTQTNLTVDTRTAKTKTSKKTKGRDKAVIGPTLNANSELNENAEPTIAWQECYDEGSGCYYYWNTDTNEVTWEIPQDMLAYRIALEQWNAQQLLAQQAGFIAAGGLVPMYANRLQKTTLQQQQKEEGSANNKAQEKSKQKKQKDNSDSENEKIELITSYGPNSEDEDSDSEPEVPIAKKKKTEISKSKTNNETKEDLTFGPMLPPGYSTTVKQEEKVATVVKEETVPVTKTPVVIADSTTSSGPDTKTKNKSETVPPSKPAAKKSEDQSDKFFKNHQPDSEKISALQRLKTLKDKDSDESDSDSGSSESDSSDSVDDSEVKKCDDNNENEDEDKDVEDSILERLKNKAKILQELGGEIPEEIKELLRTSPVDEEGQLSPSSKSRESQDNLSDTEEAEQNQEMSDKVEDLPSVKGPETIELVESESVAIDEVSDLRCTNQMEIEESINKNTTFLSNNVTFDTKLEEMLLQENAPSSFSLIASYGNEDDSELDEDKTDDKTKTTEKPVPLFPILENEQQPSPLFPISEGGHSPLPILSTAENGQKPEKLFPISENEQKPVPLFPIVENDHKTEQIFPIVESQNPIPLFPIVESEEKPVPLFPGVENEETPLPLSPSVENEEKKTIVKSKHMKKIKLSAKAKELIHSSTTTGKARATAFNTSSDGVRLKDLTTKENETIATSKLDFDEPVKVVQRKKRLEVPVIIKKEKVLTVPNELASKPVLEDPTGTASKVVSETTEAVVKQSTTAYTSTWAYNSELKGGEYRGFGYGYDVDSNPVKPAKPVKSERIQFVKADILMPKNDFVIDIPEKKVKEEEMEKKKQDETAKVRNDQAKELSQIVSEKVKFLNEGKEAVPPVQVMAIQLETLTTAWGAGGLTVEYMLEWLTSLDSQLASLEQAAAPVGWLCQWDRSYKRYYYRNEESGAIQWEYPSDPPPPVQGGEEAMELCDSPPPPLPPQTPRPKTPPPPPLSEPPPVPPPPPRISSRSPSPELKTNTEKAGPPLPPLPPPPPVISEQPPLPPLPPSMSPPPPPLPPSPPPPPPPPIISETIHSGEPLPPGVDLPEMFENSRPPMSAAPPPPPPESPPPPPPPKTPPHPPPPVEVSEPVEPSYNLSYDVPAVHYDYQLQTGTNYSGSVFPIYSGTDEGYVIARPPASNPVTTNPVPPPPQHSLANELDSFYSEVAALDEPSPVAATSPSPPPPSPPPPQPPPPQPAEPTKKRKKTKLTPGLALKKKGVPSLVAKWQQVQQDVRREEESEET